MINSQPAAMAIRSVGKVHFALDEWPRFLRSHPWWPAQAGDIQPAYPLPDDVTQFLSHRSLRSSGIYLDAVAAAAERDFRVLCENNNGAGWWHGRPVYHNILRRPPDPTHTKMKAMGWSSTAIRGVQLGLQKAAEAASRVKGVMGWLLTEPQFIEQVAILQHEWESLPSEQRPTFPFARALRALSPPEECQPAPAELSDFQNRLSDFLDCWGLMQMENWDLPHPQGPLKPCPFDADAQAMPRHGLHVVLPLHYPVQSNDQLVDEIAKYQRDAVAALGLDQSLAGLPHHEAYCTMFDVLHMERALRARMHADKPRMGVVLLIEQAIAEGLGLSIHAVQKNRKAISACRGGKRAQIHRLRSRIH